MPPAPDSRDHGMKHTHVRAWTPIVYEMNLVRVRHAAESLAAPAALSGEDSGAGRMVLGQAPSFPAMGSEHGRAGVSRAASSRNPRAGCCHGAPRGQ
jgi:hypothetical protein